MGIEDIQISEELETNAPSIKYSGSEGPKSPQEEMMMVDAVLEEEYEKYVYDLLEQRPEATPMSLEEFKRMVIGDMSGGQPLPQDPTKPVNPFAPKPTGPVLPDRQMAAYGGIMGMDGRRKYGFGSIKKRFRKLIPNEVAKVAEVAAPFVAPFNPIAAGLMSGIGGFDRTGRIGSSIKSGLMNYGMGQLARGIGGGFDNLQKGFNPFQPMQGAGKGTFSKYFSNPIQDTGGIGEMLQDKLTTSGGSLKEGVGGRVFTGDEAMIVGDPRKALPDTVTGNLLKTIKDFALDNKLLTGIATGTLGTAALMGNMKPDEIQDLGRGEGLDLESIREEVIEAMKDESGKKLAALRVKYPFLGRRDTKDIEAMGKAMGGRIGFEFGKRVPPVKMPDPLEQMLQNMTDEEKAQFKLMMRMNAERMPKYQPDPNAIPPVKMPTYPRVDRAEGGIMDLGGMEKDYRAEGGFVPIGREEKADDVPARLSVNEFVFTADAVRNAGGGDIDRGAEVMENMMKHLEQGGQVSEESQGMQGAQQMFETSERLSEVI